MNSAGWGDWGGFNQLHTWWWYGKEKHAGRNIILSYCETPLTIRLVIAHLSRIPCLVLFGCFLTYLAPHTWHKKKCVQCGLRDPFTLTIPPTSAQDLRAPWPPGPTVDFPMYVGFTVSWCFEWVTSLCLKNTPMVNATGCYLKHSRGETLLPRLLWPIMICVS